MANGAVLSPTPDYFEPRARERLIAFLVPFALALVLTLGVHWSMVWLAPLAANAATPLERALAYLSAVVLERGHIPYLEVLCFAFAMVYVAERYLYRRREKRAFTRVYDEWTKLQKRLRVNGGAISVEHSEKLLEQVKGWEARLLGSKAGRRLRQALIRFNKTKDSKEVDDLLNTLSELDGAGIESAYGNIRYLAWLIPTLGFIGTVVGIGLAISGFGRIIASVSSFAEIKGLIPGVTRDLGIAFDTTLLALVLTAILLASTAYVQKREEELLLLVDRFSIEDVAGLFVDGEPLAEVKDALVAIHSDLRPLAERRSPVAGELEGIHKVVRSLDSRSGDLDGRLRELCEAVEKGSAAEALRPLVERLEAHLRESSARSEDLLRELRDGLGEVTGKLQATAELLQEYAEAGAPADAAGFSRAVEELRAAVESLAPGLAGVERAAGEFGRASAALESLSAMSEELRSTVGALRLGGEQTGETASRFADVADALGDLKTGLAGALEQNAENTGKVEQVLADTSKRIAALTNVIAGINVAIAGVQQAVQAMAARDQV